MRSIVVGVHAFCRIRVFKFSREKAFEKKHYLFYQIWTAKEQIKTRAIL